MLKLLAGFISLILGFTSPALLVAKSTPIPTPAPDPYTQIQDSISHLHDKISGLRYEVEQLKVASSFTRVLKRGQSGEDVRKLQELLFNLGDTKGTYRTGYFGSLTEQDVKKFQKNIPARNRGV